MSKRKKRDVYCADDLVISENAHGKFGKDKKAGDQLAVFAVRFNRLLEEKGIDQKKLAADLAISPGAVSSYRNGKSEPGLTKIVQIAEYLDVDCTYLMTGVSPENRTFAAEAGLSENAIETLKLINKGGNSEEQRTIRMINRVLDYSPSVRKNKAMPFSLLFILLDQYVTSENVKWEPGIDGEQGLDDMPANFQRSRKNDEGERRFVYVKFGKVRERMEFRKLYRESRIAAVREGLDRFLKEENKRNNI